jgi:hypothetical protein
MAAYVYMTNKKKRFRKDTPHPIDLKDLKTPLMQACNKEERSMPNLVRRIVKQWLELNHPELLNEIQ